MEATDGAASGAATYFQTGEYARWRSFSAALIGICTVPSVCVERLNFQIPAVSTMFPDPLPHFSIALHEFVLV
jgi:hypothetical protein